MIATETRPLSELYREDQRRIAEREANAIIARHRMIFAANRVAAEKALHQDIKEIEL